MNSKVLNSALALFGAALGMAATPSMAECLPAPPSLVEAGYLTVGTSLTAPPMGFMKDDTPSGFDPEFITAVAEKMCLKTKIVNVTFQGLFPGLIAKKFDVIASQIGITEPRKEMFDLLAMFSLGDLVIGPDTQLVDTLRRINGLEWGIENPFIRMTLYQGAIVTALVTLAFGLFMYELGRGRRGVWLPMLVWVILLNGSESIATKTTLVAKFIMVVLCLYPLGSRAGRVTRASSAPARRPWPGRAAG